MNWMEYNTDKIKSLWEAVLDCQKRIMTALTSNEDNELSLLATQYDALVRDFVAVSKNKDHGNVKLFEHLKTIQEFDKTVIKQCKLMQQRLIIESSDLRKARLGVKAYTANSTF